MLTRVILL